MGKPLMCGSTAAIAILQLAAIASPATRPESPAISVVDLSSPSAWQPMPDWLANPAGKSTVTAGRGLRFSVAEPGRGMKWRFAPAQPVTTAGHEVLTIRYRASGIARRSDYFLYLGDMSSGQPQREFDAFSLSAVIDDGAWHQLSVEVPAMRVTTFAMQAQAVGTGSYVEIAEICLALSRPTYRLKDYLDIQPGRTQAQDYRTMDFCPNIPAKPWLAQIGMDPAWFAQPEVAIDGIPFRVHVSEPQVLATSLEQLDDVSLEVGSPAEGIYLLMGARFAGEESPSLGTGPLVQVRQVERFVVRIKYADGIEEQIFPARLPSGQHVVTQEPGVYVVQPSRPDVIKRLHLVDGMRNGQFVLAGITLGPRVQSSGGASQSAPIATRPVRSLVVPPDAITTPTTALILSGRPQKAKALINRITECSWLTSPSPLYTVEPTDKIEATLNARPLPSDEIELNLQLVNNSTQPVTVTTTFPQLTGLDPGGDARDLQYCFPRRGCAITSSDANLREPYSGLFPLQFMDVWHPQAGGLYMMVHDTSNTPKTYWLSKHGSLDMGVDYWPTTLQPGQRWILPPAVIGAHRGDWHAALQAYRRWLTTWYRPLVERKQWFREVFNFRQQFLNFAFPRPNGMFDPKTRKLDFMTAVKADAEKFGGIDYLHLFDWGWTPDHGRCGDYDPWLHLGGLEQFAQQVHQVQDAGIPVGLYIEGYLIDPASDIAKQHGQAWQMLRADGQPYTTFAPSLNMCPQVPAWQYYLAGVYGRVARETGAKGYYIDEFGNAAFYICHNPSHGHPTPTSPVRDEQVLTQKVRKAVPGEAVVYTEDTPTDVSSQYQDGSFTYAICCSLDYLSPVPLNLTRFALPDFKTFEIIACDKPLADDQQAVKRVFFNGEGIWLEGMADDWFAPETRTLIAKTHHILRQYRQAFMGPDPIPLAPTGHRDVWANRFSSTSEVVWTLYNSAYWTVRGDLLSVDHLPGATYADAWNNRQIFPRISGNQAFLSFELGPRDVGCVVQHR